MIGPVPVRGQGLGDVLGLYFQPPHAGTAGGGGVEQALDEDDEPGDLHPVQCGQIALDLQFDSQAISGGHSIPRSLVKAADDWLQVFGWVHDLSSIRSLESAARFRST